MEEIKGHIESIIYAQQDNGFTVARLKESVLQSTCIVGIMPGLQCGEEVFLKGEWKTHPKFGRQFDVKSYTVQIPSDIVGIEKYLSSGLVNGIGPVYAKKIVAQFKEKTLEIIDETPHRLLEVEGIGKKRVEMITECWSEQRTIRQVMIFLRTHGITPAYAQRIYKVYGDNSIKKVRENPYQLARDIFGIGFKMSDALAVSLGFGLNSPERINAGIEYVLSTLTQEGHTCYPREDFLPKAQSILEVDEDLIDKQITKLINDKQIHGVSEPIPMIWLRSLYSGEQGIAKEIQRLLRTPMALREILMDKAIDWVQKKLEIELENLQQVALQHCLTEKIHIVTGGPGTGKSTITQAILAISEKISNQILLAAPTGRAAKRLTQITRKKAFTIHGLLEFDFATGGFKRNEENKLKAELLIIDEASMIDTYLMHQLLLAIPDKTRVLFIGDVDQLPSVGPGCVLKDLIESNTMSVTRLTEIFRQAKGSKIITNAHKIQSGNFPELTHTFGSDFHFYEEDDPEKIQQKILSLVQDDIPKWRNLDPIDAIQVLSPMKRGIIGIEALNTLLQEKLNPCNQPFIRSGRRFHINDKVMQLRNNYDKKVFNGDVGKIIQIDIGEQTIIVGFNEKFVTYDFTELDEITLAYAVSVHKYQGSECPVIVMPVHTSHFKLLYRNLLYTAVTRGKYMVVLVGSKKAVAIAVKNDQVNLRHTGLEKALCDALNNVPLFEASLADHTSGT